MFSGILFGLVPWLNKKDGKMPSNEQVILYHKISKKATPKNLLANDIRSDFHLGSSQNKKTTFRWPFYFGRTYCAIHEQMRCAICCSFEKMLRYFWIK